MLPQLTKQLRLQIAAVPIGAKSAPKCKEAFELIKECDKIMGLDLHVLPKVEEEDEHANDDPALVAEVEAAIAARAAAKKAKDYAEADRIRNDLAAKGIILTDTPKGVKWKKN